MRRTISVLAALALLVALAACGDDDDVDSTGTTAAPTTDTTAEPDTTEAPDTEPGTEPGDVESQALVYFAWNELIGAAGRAVDGDDDAEAALEALLEGPDDFETDIGMGTEIPEGTELLGVETDGGTATVDLSSDFEAGGGSLSMQMRVAQVVFTLTALDDVDSVTITLDGEAVDGIGGEGVEADGLTRESFEDLSPAILVESPTPGQDVTSPVTVEGTANTFEATVQYAVTDGEGLIVAEGFTTATSGSGERGTFSVEVDFEPERTGLGAVIVWQDDAESGEQRDVYEVPVRME
jgi:germination protein M